MQFNPPLQPATLIKRYKRFLADAITPDGNIITLHCANTGAMTGCATSGDTIWYSTSNNSKRKYAYTWELTQTSSGDWICVNTHRANSLIKEAIEKEEIAELTGYDTIKSEAKYGAENSRVDLLLQSDEKSDCYIEVKSVTLLENNCGYFPDAVTVRGQKHIRELQHVVMAGKRSVLLFAVLHTGIKQIAIAKHIDNTYNKLLYEAQINGVEIFCYSLNISNLGIFMKERLPLLPIVS